MVTPTSTPSAFFIGATSNASSSRSCLSIAITLSAAARSVALVIAPWAVWRFLRSASLSRPDFAKARWKVSTNLREAMSGMGGRLTPLQVQFTC